MSGGKSGIGSILVVNDPPESLTHLTDVLSASGYRVRTSASGRLALKAIRKSLPDLILIDNVPSPMDGPELCRLIRTEKRASQTPVIYIGDRNPTLGGCDVPEIRGVDLINRPYKIEYVLARVRTHLKKGAKKKIQQQYMTFQSELAKYNLSEERAHESESRFRSLLEASPDPIVIYAPGGQTEFVNPAFQRLYGWTLDELQRQPVDFVPEDEIENTREGWVRTLAGENYQFETKRLTKQQRLLNIELHTAILRDADGAHSASIVIHRDITKKKQAENLLIRYRERLEELVAERTNALNLTNLELQQEINQRKSAQEAIAIEKAKLASALQEMSLMRLYLKNIIDSMPSVMVGVDRDGRITHWNRQAEEITGISPDQACGNPLPPLFAKLNLRIDNVRESIRQKRTHKMEKVAHQINGETRFADITIYPLVTDGVQGAVIRVDDISSRVRIEDIMVQTEKMLSVGGLAAGMAHEINNPLSGILQSLQNIQIRLSPAHPRNLETARLLGIDLTALDTYLENRGITQSLEAIKAAGIKAAEIVANMLNFTRKSESEMRLVEFSSIVNSAVELAAHEYDLKKKYDFRKIVIEKKYAPNLPKVRCIKTEIEQVLLNLLRNAAQAMMDYSTKGQPKIVISLAREDTMVCMKVKDNGPGLDESARKRVFEPFFTTKSIGVGTGLGLSVSYFIITQHHGGTMTVKSEPGKGTCFTIRLPINGRKS
jgi:PAS domain S-box-containing protein